MDVRFTPTGSQCPVNIGFESTAVERRAETLKPRRYRIYKEEIIVSAREEEEVYILGRDEAIQEFLWRML